MNEAELGDASNQQVAGTCAGYSASINKKAAASSNLRENLHPPQLSGVKR